VTDSDDAVMHTRLDVAEMKGMLTQLVSAHAERIHAAEVRLSAHEVRLNEKKAQIARHDERIQDLEDDNSGRWGRVMGVLGLIASGIAIFVSWLPG
jgi:hypothetical protein